MTPNPVPGCLRFGLTALVVLALLIAAAVPARWWAPARPPVVDAGALASHPGAHLGQEVVVTGEWLSAGPSETGYMVVVLRGRYGGPTVCHFEDVPAADRVGLETRVCRPGEVAVRGRCDGVEDGLAVLRGCSLPD